MGKILNIIYLIENLRKTESKEKESNDFSSDKNKQTLDYLKIDALDNSMIKRRTFTGSRKRDLKEKKEKKYKRRKYERNKKRIQ